MTLSDYILDLVLIGIVVLQVRGRRLTFRSLLLPVGIVVLVAYQYLRGVPTAGNDLILVGLAAGLGITLGLLTGWFTSVRPGPDGYPFAKAGAAAAVLWVVGVGTRFAFQVYSSHGGAGAIGRFSAANHITSSDAWVAALILMALGEAVARTALLGYRGYSLSPSHFLGRPAMIGSGGRAS
jgi:hypothetical protein